MPTAHVPQFKYEPEKDKMTPDKMNIWAEKKLSEPAHLFSHNCVHLKLRPVQPLLMPSLKQQAHSHYFDYPLIPCYTYNETTREGRGWSNHSHRRVINKAEVKLYIYQSAKLQKQQDKGDRLRISSYLYLYMIDIHR